MADFEEVAGVELLHPSGGDRSLPASALTRQKAGGQNPGSGDGREGVPNFATNGTRSGVKTGGGFQPDEGGYRDFGGYSRERRKRRSETKMQN